MIKSFLVLPTAVRSAILLLAPLLLWFIFRPVILWCLSLLPFLLRLLFRGFYRLIEMFMSIVHQKIGRGFYEIANRFSQTGKKIDKGIYNWFCYWHSPKKGSKGATVLIYLVCVALIGFPSLLNTDHEFLKIFENIYLARESSLVAWLEERGWNDDDTSFAWKKKADSLGDVVSDEENSEIKLVVSGVKTSLLVRDIPSMETDMILARVFNGDSVVWNGKMAFSKAEDGFVEVWAQIVTPDGIEGWSRMSYLIPEQYENREFYVIGQGD